MKGGVKHEEEKVLRTPLASLSSLLISYDLFDSGIMYIHGDFTKKEYAYDWIRRKYLTERSEV